MPSLLFLFIHFLVVLAKLLGPGGGRSVVAENLLLKHQLLIIRRSRHRAPALSPADRICLGWLSQFITPRRRLRVAVVIKPATLLRFHQALVKHKYRWLFSSRRREYLDHVLFWNAADLDRKLNTFKDYYNGHRVHASIEGKTPEQVSGDRLVTLATLDRFAWMSHCRGLFQTPVPA